MRFRILTGIALCGLVTSIAVPLAVAGPTPDQKCLSKKLKEVGKYDFCRLKAESKSAIKGGAPDLAKCAEKLTDKWSKIEAAGGCSFAGDQAAAQALSDVYTDDVVALLAPTPDQKCLSKKLKEAGKYDFCRLKAESKSASKGGPADVAKCSEKFADNWIKIEAAGGCAVDDGPAALALTDVHTDVIVELLSNGVIPDCGNGALNIGEQCDDTLLNGFACENFGFSAGVGVLGCTGSCSFDTSGCVELCGNGDIDAGSYEVCDGANLGGADCSTYGGTGTLACNSDCYDFDTSGCTVTCGDSVGQLDEDCDGADLRGQSCSSLDLDGGTLACNGSCEFDTSACAATCGDDYQNPGEECDGALFLPNCELAGYHAGSLACTGSCTYDVTDCTSECDFLAQDCGAGQGCYLDFAAFGLGNNPGGCQTAGTGAPLVVCTEQDDCAPGMFCTGFASEGVCTPFCDRTIGDSDCPAGYGFTCGDIGGAFPASPNLGICETSPLPPAALCGNGSIDYEYEDCDGTELGGWDCLSFGFDSGTLACDAACGFDTSGCVLECGNNTIDGFEACDGANLGGSDCTTFGGTGGTLACLPSCYGFDYSGCTSDCGDGSVAYPIEQCDLTNLYGGTCGGLGFGPGTLACDGSCQYDTAGCAAPVCGDGIFQPGNGEDCDDTDGLYGGCTSQYYHSGTLACDGSCAFDVSSCVLECDYLAQDCAVGEGCYFDYLGGGDGGCKVEGSAQAGDPCSAQNDCAAGNFCDFGSVCTPFCDSSNGNADCPVGGFCYQFPDVPVPNFGICF